jgi:hypothetical protein
MKRNRIILLVLLLAIVLLGLLGLRCDSAERLLLAGAGKCCGRLRISLAVA